MMIDIHDILRDMAVASMLVILMGTPWKAKAQSDAMLSHYMEVPAYYNPSAIGITDNLRINGAARLQWIGIDNAPQTFLGTANMPLKIMGRKVAVGVMLQQESAGLYNNLTLGAQLGYKMKLFKGELTAGLQVGFIDEGFKGSKVVLPDDDDYHQDSDDAIPRSDIHGTGLDLGVGVFYSHPKFWAGLSCTHVNSPSIKLQGEGMSGNGASTSGGTGGEGSTTGVKNYEFQQPRSLYFMAGSNIPIKNTLFEVMPSIIVASDLTFTTGQATVRGRYNKFLTAGVGYRYNDAVIAMLGAEFKGIYIGYSYEYSTSAIAKASSGSHEIVLGYSLKLDFSDKNRHRHKNIRIM